MEDMDTYRTAWLLVRKHGEDAPLESATRADAMLEKGDLDGKLVWLSVMKATKELLDRSGEGKERH
jgi:hypothetical protein